MSQTQQTQQTQPQFRPQSSATAIAVDRAIKLLTAAGAAYHIKSTDGVEYGKPLKGEKVKRGFLGPNNGALIAKLFSDLVPGTGAIVTPQEGDTPERLARCINSAAGRYVGSAKNIITAVTPDGFVEVLRVE